jgi:glutathione S-transferase
MFKSVFEWESDFHALKNLYSVIFLLKRERLFPDHLIMKLYGSLTSPYVRRIRFIALELGVPFSIIDTMTEEGQAELRKKNPLWKVPYAELEATKIWDSHAITDYLLETSGPGPFRLTSQTDRWQESNLIYAMDGALDSGINLFYLGKDGVTSETSVYIKKQKDRISSVILYLKAQLKEDFFFPGPKLGRAEINFFTVIDWLRFREVYPVAEDPILTGFLAKHSQNPNWEKTAPPK